MPRYLDCDTICLRIDYLCHEKSVSINRMLTDIGLHKSAIDNIRRGRAPSVFTICWIAEYLNVTVEYLMGYGNIQENSSKYEKPVDNTPPTTYNKGIGELATDSIQVAQAYQALPTNEDKNYIRRALRLPELESETEKGVS